MYSMFAVRFDFFLISDNSFCETVHPCISTNVYLHTMFMPMKCLVTVKDILCNLKFLKNRTKFFSRKTSFHQFSNMASLVLKKMLILIILYTHESVSVNICPLIFLLDTIF